jgi:hypothetical protein
MASAVMPVAVSRGSLTTTSVPRPRPSLAIPRRFIRLSRGSLVNIDTISKIGPMPGGTYLATLSNGDELQVSRIQSRVLRDTLPKL